MSTATYVAELQDQLIDTVKSVQEPIVEAVRTVADTVDGVLPSYDLPLADQLPAPEALAQLSFAFAQRLLETSRDFTVAVLEAATPAGRRDDVS